MSIGNFARRAMELGGFPTADRWYGPGVHSKVEGGGSIPPERPENRTSVGLSQIRLIEAMRKIDPDLAHMIESLAPVYLVKQ
jgi:hypothetical protein